MNKIKKYRIGCAAKYFSLSYINCFFLMMSKGRASNVRCDCMVCILLTTPMCWKISEGAAIFIYPKSLSKIWYCFNPEQCSFTGASHRNECDINNTLVVVVFYFFFLIKEYTYDIYSYHVIMHRGGCNVLPSFNAFTSYLTEKSLWSESK